MQVAFLLLIALTYATELTLTYLFKLFNNSGMCDIVVVCLICFKNSSLSLYRGWFHLAFYLQTLLSIHVLSAFYWNKNEQNKTTLNCYAWWNWFSLSIIKCLKFFTKLNLINSWGSFLQLLLYVGHVNKFMASSIDETIVKSVIPLKWSI